MYDVNTAEINRRLAYVQIICDTAKQIVEHARDDAQEGVYRFAAQRAVHLAAECVTDVGSYMIDGFIMRDASSYEDIVDILHGEQVFDAGLHEFLLALVRQRKPLVQEYDRLDEQELHRLTALLPIELPRFDRAVRTYLQKELSLSGN